MSYFMNCVYFLILCYDYEELLSVGNSDQDEGNGAAHRPSQFCFIFFIRLPHHFVGFGINPCRPGFHCFPV